MTNSRRKGIRGEQEAARLWQRWFPECKRSYGQARNEFSQPDLLGTGRFYVEVKRRKVLRGAELARFWRKLIEDSDRYEREFLVDVESILMYRADYSPWMIAMYVDGARELDLIPYGATIVNAKKLVDKDGFDNVVSMTWERFAEAMDRAFAERES